MFKNLHIKINLCFNRLVEAVNGKLLELKCNNNMIEFTIKVNKKISEGVGWRINVHWKSTPGESRDMIGSTKK